MAVSIGNGSGSSHGNGSNGHGPQRPRRSPEEVRRDLERTRALVTASVTDLRREVAARTDWRHVVRQRPLAVVAAAFLLGFFIARR